jgi:hypothetical protein
LEAFGGWREDGVESTSWILKAVLVLEVSDEPLEFFLTKGFEVWVDSEEGQQAKPVSTQRSSHGIALSISPSTAYIQAIWCIWSLPAAGVASKSARGFSGCVKQSPPAASLIRK